MGHRSAVRLARYNVTFYPRIDPPRTAEAVKPMNLSLLVPSVARPAQENVEVIHAPERQRGALFGRAVALAGDCLAVGEPGRLGADEATTGAVYLYTRYRGRWRLRRTLTGRDAGLPDGANFGAALALDRGRLIIGAPSAPPAGAVCCFTFLNAFECVEPVQTIGPDVPRLAPGAWFGYAVALHERRLAVGAAQGDGSVHLFTFTTDALTGRSHVSSIGVGIETAIAPGRAGAFGHGVALNARWLVVGADKEAPEGAVHIYDVSRDFARPTLVDIIQHRTASPIEGLHEYFGASVALRGGVLYVGGPGNDGPHHNVCNLGAVHRFALGAPGARPLGVALRGHAAEAMAGYDVAVSRRWLAAGAPHADDGRGAVLIAPL
jgi:hypothetical protein